MYTQKNALRGSVKLFVIGICTLAAIAFFVVLYRDSMQQADLPEAANLPAEEQLSGSLYFSLARPDGNMAAYVLQPATSRFTYDEMSWFDNASPMFHSFSADGTQVAFVGISDSEIATIGGNAAEALQVRRATLEPDELFPAWSETERVSEGAMPIKQNPTINDAGRVLFMARDTFEDGVDSIVAEAEAWSVYLADENGMTKVTNGTYPKWISRERFIYFKNDGLYLYNVTNDTEKQIWDTPIPVESNMKLDVSDDRQYVAWTLPDVGLVTVAVVTGSWDEGTPNLDLHGEIQTHGFWTAISPDNSFVAVQAVDWEALATDPRPRVEFYAMDTMEKLEYEVPLLEFDQKRMFLTDWVK